MENDDIRSTRKMCESMVDTVLDLFIEHMQEAARNDDDIMLEPQELVVQRRAFKEKRQDKYLKLTRKIAEAWLSRIEKDHWNQSRKRPFERILVHRFSHLFPPSESLENEGAISRRALPGIMAAFERLAGHEFIEQCQGAARKIFRQVRENQGDGFTWDDYYNEPAANRLADDLMAVIVWSFRDINVRMKWTLDLINRNLAPPEDYAFEGEAVNAWTMKEQGLAELLGALLFDFKENFTHEEGRKPLNARYGEKACEAIEDVLGQLDGLCRPPKT
ncbi:MAG: hypothetical protein V3R66_06130 [Rhodospirillales bacterium]